MKTTRPGNRSKDKHGIKPERFLLPVFAGFLVLILPYFMVTNAIDYSLMPRFMLLSVFILGFTLYLFFKKNKPDISSISGYRIFLLLGIYLLIIPLSLFFAVNKQEAGYDFFKWVVFSSVIILGSLLFISDQRWPSVISKFSVVSGIVSGLIGLVQYYLHVVKAVHPFLPDGRSVVYLVEGVMSHKNLFSLSLFMLMPWVGYGIYALRKGWRKLAAVSMTLLVVMILLLLTRAVWLGILISLPVIILLFLYYFRQNISRSLFRAVMIIMMAGMIGFIGFIFIAQLVWVQNPFAEKLMSIVRVSAWKTENRLKAWKLTTEMIADHPVSGVGAGNWQIAAPNYFAGKFKGNEELNWIRPHNDYLWIWAEKGIAGIILYLAIFGLTIYYLYSSVKYGSVDQKVLGLFLLWGIIGFMVASFFDFPYERPFHMAALALLIAGAVALFHQQKPLTVPGISGKIVWLTMILLLLISTVSSLAVYRQETLVKKCLEDASGESWERMLVHGQQAQSVFKNLDNWANPIETYIGKAQEEMGDIPGALQSYEIAFIHNPTKIKVLVNLARCYEKDGKYEQALQVISNGLRILPRDRKLSMQKCDVLYAMGKYKMAVWVYKQIPGWNSDSLIVQNLRYLKHLIKGSNASPVKKSQMIRHN